MEELIQKASTLIEALPYIKSFRGKEILVKYGGAALRHGEVRKHILQDLVFMQFVGIKPILVHGGGKHITENMEKKGLPSKFVNGLRVTDEAAVQVVVETLAGINRELVNDLNHLGGSAVGLSGHDNDILHVERHTKNGDVGFVGDVSKVNIFHIRQMTDAGIIPVIYPVGIDKTGQTYNVNADEAACNIAMALKVPKMMMLTDVKGVMRDPKDESSLVPTLTLEETEKMIRDGIISGGMIPKVESCLEVLRHGVKKAHIVDGRMKHPLLLEVFTDKGVGTEFVR